ncbi:MAG: NlpC/P60 family protein [Pseudomonadota bacterium]
MTARRLDILVTARSWIGTPYIHQASTRGAGCDCLGLIRGVWREVIGPEPMIVPAYTPDWSEADGQETLLISARAFLIEKALNTGMPGDVILFRMRDGGIAKHLGILSGTGAAPKFIHSYQRHGVVESPLSTPWRNRVVGCFAFPD